MKVEVTRVTCWKDVLNAARFTQRKEPLNKEPSDTFKKNIIRAEHSPLRCLMFNIDFYDVPYYVSVHFVRHVHAQPFVSTSRPDILTGEIAPRHLQKKTDPVNMRLFLNAQEILHISRARKCGKAEGITRAVWKKALLELAKIEPLLAAACVPSCIYRGFCPEIKSCGYDCTELFTKERTNYINTFRNDNT